MRGGLADAATAGGLWVLAVWLACILRERLDPGVALLPCSAGAGDLVCRLQ